jgi:YesN/AraC family two-component response regulator
MMNLLIADDEAIIREGLLSLDWESININVIGVTDNGLDALEIIQSEFVDIVLSDIRMQGLDGIGIAKFIFEQQLYSEVILLSGYNDFNYARNAIRYNVREYILKPSDPDEIIAAVSRVSEQVNQRKEKDMRFRLLEAELGRKQLVLDNNHFVIGEIEISSAAKQVLDYISKNYHKAISLSAISEDMHFSTTYLSKIIKKSTGYNFLDILTAMRVCDAAEKLREDSLSFTQICESVSIDDPRYFSQVFKKYFGVTPSAYRKQPTMPTNVKLAYIVRSLCGRDYE